MKTISSTIYGRSLCWRLPAGRSYQRLAVVPAPDGGYPGGNTAEGQNALLSLTTGGFNTADGWVSLRAVTTGSFNTAIGAGTLLANTARRKYGYRRRWASKQYHWHPKHGQWSVCPF